MQDGQVEFTWLASYIPRWFTYILKWFTHLQMVTCPSTKRFDVKQLRDQGVITMSNCHLYRVAQIKQCHFTFLLVRNECIYKILWFLARINHIKQQMARCQFYNFMSTLVRQRALQTWVLCNRSGTERVHFHLQQTSSRRKGWSWRCYETMLYFYFCCIIFVLYCSFYRIMVQCRYYIVVSILSLLYCHVKYNTRCFVY